MTGVYLHIPFCLRKCPYCSFYSVKYNNETVSGYVKALIRNIKAYKGMGVSADTIYFGGGTPSLLTPEQVGSIIAVCDECFALHEPEITLETNPCTAGYEKLRQFHKAGVNRLSIGIQSADDEQLRSIGRLHDFKRAVKAVEDAKKAGFENISGDLMLGLKGQDEKNLETTLAEITRLPLVHISAYMLKIEEGTPFYNEETIRSAADEELMCRLYTMTVETLDRYGFKQYEISNFSLNGKVSRHNLKYWHGEDYLGFGPQAHSFYNGVRYFCGNSVNEYISADIQNKTVSEENIDKGEEYILLGLRLNEGICISRVEKYCGAVNAKRLLDKAVLLEKHGYVRVLNGNISLSTKGMLVSNSVIYEFLDSAGYT